MMKHLMTEIILRSFLLPLSAILLLQNDNISFAFAPTTKTRTTALYKYHSSQTIPVPAVAAVPSEDDTNNNDDDNAWQTALQQRLSSIQKKKSETRTRWLTADFEQTLYGTPDWVRRVSVQWPLAVCGTSSGDIYVIQCESGAILGKGRSRQDQRRYADVSPSSSRGLELETTLRQLFGEFDGGGTLSIGLSWTNYIAHAGRNGGVEFWTIDTDRFDDDDDNDDDDDEPYDLISQGTLLDDVLVTCLDWAKDDLWIGTQDGRVLVYTIDDDDDELPSKPVQEFKNIGGAVLSIKFNEELDVAAATTSSGLVELLTIQEPDRRRSFNPPFDSGRMSSNAFPLCAIIVEEEQDGQEELEPLTASSSSNKRKFSLACGGNDGSVFLRSLQLLDDGTIDPELDLECPFPTDSAVRALVPGHQGPCKCLESPFPGMLLSGGQDGTVRVWEFNADTDDDETANGAYILGGFKVWLGSFCTDGERLVMDGADNAISILDFGGGGDS